MKIAVVGTGYVGLIQAVGLARLGHQVICLDVNEKKIQELQSGRSPIYEPGLDDIMQEVIRLQKIEFTTSKAEALSEANIIFVAVGTPSKEDGSAELKYVNGVVEDIVDNGRDDSIVVIKSTVPLGTNEKIQGEFEKEGKSIKVVSNPEFLREGTAIEDFLNPDRVVVGSSDREAARTVADLYGALKCPVVLTDFTSAELIKYASNAFLALEISYINNMALLSDAVGADIAAVSKGMRLDKRIGDKAFLHAGVGYGGSCFPKDVKALIQMSGERSVVSPILQAVHDINDQMRSYAIKRFEKECGDLKGKKIAVWGIAFKPNTDDVRESPALDIIELLSGKGAEVTAYDPIVKEVADLEARITATAIEACKEADGLILVTDWPEFKAIDMDQVARAMKGKCVIDGRNALDPQVVVRSGLNYFGIGRQSHHGDTLDILER